MKSALQGKKPERGEMMKEYTKQQLLLEHYRIIKRDTPFLVSQKHRSAKIIKKHSGDRPKNET